MKSLLLFPVVLLVYSTVVCAASQEDDQVVTTREFRKELNRAGQAMLATIFQFFIPGYTPSHPACSCKEILQLAPQSPSGLYWISGTDNKPKHMYCDMERSCKGVTGGWMRVASFDMTDTSSTCPSGLRTPTGHPRLCSEDVDLPRYQCSTSIIFPVQGIKYSQVCGKIIGYQFGNVTDFIRVFPTGPKVIDNINATYVDGVSLTHGSPREHIWTFAAAIQEYNSDQPKFACPCINTRLTPLRHNIPGFVGRDYFCDTGSENEVQNIFYGDDPLWDGAGCGEYNTCCDFNSPPWFRKEISPPTSDDIEMRLCAFEHHQYADVYVESVEIYVQ